MNEGWSDFFVAQVGAAAALSGLVIVAISINLQRILAEPQLPGRASEALMTLVSAMLVASVGLIPHQSARALGFEILGISVVALASGLFTQARSMMMRRDQPMQWWLPRLVISLTAVLPMAIGGLLLALGIPDGLHWSAAGVLLSLAAGVFNTWVLLIEILR